MKVVVLAGGTSTERDVSLSSGAKIYTALKGNGHDVVLLDVFLGYECEDTKNVFSLDKNWAESIGSISAQNPDIEAVKAMRDLSVKGFFGPNVIAICQEADMVFMALHGEEGENGKIQAAFDLLGIKYTGNDYVSSALAMDKCLAKELFEYYNIPTPKGTRLLKGEEDLHIVPLPCVIKTPFGGSSIGVYIANTLEEYEAYKEEAFGFGDEVLIEEFIKGREFAVAVIAGEALPVIEIAPISGFYDYKNKYQAGSAIETCPADIDEVTTKNMQKAAEEVFAALRLTTYARMDFLLKENGEFYCLEANTLPGMTPTSLLPQEAAAIGINYSELCEKIMKLSM